ncbi:MAG: glycine--tRNA ligase subunit beta [Myxococcaceae bacterium]|nr:glycine--tRNA ligase subunit beta [Myxococcaceae bacterium]
MPADLLLELHAEELPASFIGPALDDLARMITEGLAAARLKHGEVRRFGTPRRLAILVKELADTGQDISKEQLGPSVKAAFVNGVAQKPAIMFAQSVKLPVEQLKRITTPKGEYLGAQVEEKGRRAAEILPDVLSKAVHELKFRKSMRWGDVEQSFARPLHSIIALLGSEVVPVTFADVKSGRQTRGHRFLANAWLTLDRPADYEAAMDKVHVVADIAKRRAMVVDRISAAAVKAGGKLLEDNALIDQVTNLVELPSPVVGSFEPKHLDLPPEVLVQEMKSHQRYFSLLDPSGKLLPKFIAVSNTPVRDEALSVKGYERVLQARLSDGRFFFDEDRRSPLAERVPKLERVTWLKELGSIAEKVERFRALALWLAQQTGRQALEPTLERAATLCKADLVTGMVGEFPELQGVMGREYALASGEPKEVALAIFEHYLPRNAGDTLPTQDAGAILGLADRLDTLCCLFAIGKRPTGAADPTGLRRIAIAIVNLTLAKGYRFSLGQAVEKALELVAPKLKDVKLKPGQPPAKVEILEFIRGRLEQLWADAARADVANAVLSAGFDDLVSARLRLDAMAKRVGGADFAPLAATFKRVANIVAKQAKDVQPGPVEAALLKDPPEVALHAALEGVKGQVAAAVARDDYPTALGAMASLKPVVDTFFEKVMVMAEDKQLMSNRVRLLMDVAGLFNRVADFAQIQSEI